jgi:hypothetical protein
MTLVGVTPGAKQAIVRDATGKMASVKFANLGVPVTRTVPSQASKIGREHRIRNGLNGCNERFATGALDDLS